MKFLKDGSALLFLHQGERVRIEPWGQDSLRVRASMAPEFSGKDWALTEPPAPAASEIAIERMDVTLSLIHI